MGTNEMLDLDLLDPALYRSGVPHDRYAELRETGSVLRHPRTYVPAFDAEIEFWAVIAHHEVQQANRDWETFSSRDGTTIVPFPPKRRGTMIASLDPPDLVRMRRLVSAGFTPRMIGRLEEKIRARTDLVLDEAAAKGDVDFVPDIAHQLPMHA
jgi:cytochrome P450